jgi:hypothetical protein
MEKSRPCKVVEWTRVPVQKRQGQKVPFDPPLLMSGGDRASPLVFCQQKRSILDRSDQTGAKLNTRWLDSVWRCCRQKDGRHS